MMNEYLLKLTPADIRVIDRALQDVPYRLAAPLIAKLNAQIQAQEADEPGPAS